MVQRWWILQLAIDGLKVATTTATTAAPAATATSSGAVVGRVLGGGIGLLITPSPLGNGELTPEALQQMAESSEVENKGQTKPEVGNCPTCGGETSNKPGKIADAHGLKPREVKDAIHGVKGSANLPNNPDVEVCNECGEVFPQTEEGGLGDSIGNIKDKN